MRILLIAVGSKMPAWVNDGVAEYSKRLPPECRLEVIEIPLIKRGKNPDTERYMRQEAEKMMAAIPASAHVVTLEVEGKPWSTPKLSQRLESWLGGGQDVALLVGGPEGLHPSAMALAKERWSLSNLTLPHPLVRIVVTEQVYRAWSILKGHPYHK